MPLRLWLHKKLCIKIFQDNETISKILTGECCARTISNIKNLYIFRGEGHGSMSGPHEYYGHLLPTAPFTIPFYAPAATSPEARPLPHFDAQWHAHCLENNDDSLFPHPGLLFLNTKQCNINLPDISWANLPLFNVALYNNAAENMQFDQRQIAQYSHTQHKLRLITYIWGNKYMEDYVLRGNGVFIEQHEFIQTISPTNTSCGGFVILARWCGGQMILGKVTIPYGYTLLIHPFALHGDSNLIGKHVMAMTGNHEAMATADTVFIKNIYGENISFGVSTAYDGTENIIYSQNTGQIEKICRDASHDAPFYWQPMIMANAI